MKTNKLIILLSAIALIIIWGCEKDAVTSDESDQQLSILKKGKPPVKSKFLGPWGEPDGLTCVFGTKESEAAAQSFPCNFEKKRKIISIWARLARTGNPTDAYFMTLRTGLDGEILGQSLDVPVADVISYIPDWEGEWVEFPLPKPVPVVAGDYFVQMERTGPGDKQNFINWVNDWRNPLPDHAGWVKSELLGWTMFGPKLSDEFLIKISYK